MLPDELLVLCQALVSSQVPAHALDSSMRVDLSRLPTRAGDGSFNVVIEAPTGSEVNRGPPSN